MKPTKLLSIALGVALGRLNHKQKWRLGAAAVRSDGVLVVSFNGSPKDFGWDSHAESRLCKKLTPDSVVAVARVLANGETGISRPCESCQRCLHRVGVRKVYYTISEKEYGILEL